MLIFRMVGLAISHCCWMRGVGHLKDASRNHPSLGLSVYLGEFGGDEHLHPLTLYFVVKRSVPRVAIRLVPPFRGLTFRRLLISSWIGVSSDQACVSVTDDVSSISRRPFFLDLSVELASIKKNE